MGNQSRCGGHPGSTAFLGKFVVLLACGCTDLAAELGAADASGTIDGSPRNDGSTDQPDSEAESDGGVLQDGAGLDGSRDAGNPCDPFGTPFGGGAGTVDTPFLVCTGEQLSRLDSSSSFYRITANIEVDQEWAPVDVFGGTLDGGGHTLRGIHVQAPGVDDVGGFVNLLWEGTVHNLHFDGPRATAANRIGAVFGGIRDSVVSQVTVTAFDIVTTGTGSGGLAGRVRNSVLEDVVVSGRITATDEDATGGAYAGLVAGLFEASGARGIRATGMIDMTGAQGGVIGGGFAGGSRQDCSLENAHIDVVLDGQVFLGGAYGDSVGDLSFKNVLVTGSIRGASGVAGLVGLSRSARGTTTLTLDHVLVLASLSVPSGTTCAIAMEDDGPTTVNLISQAAIANDDNPALGSCASGSMIPRLSDAQLRDPVTFSTWPSPPFEFRDGSAPTLLD